jgi:hypothetical protein
MKSVAGLALIVALYFISSGMAFVAMYKWPERWNPKMATAAYAPLEWIVRRSRTFGRFYTAFHWWCWRLAGRPSRVRGAPDMPPPPPFAEG